MFNVGGGEFLIIALVALIVLGPTKLPEAARQVSRVVGEFRKLTTSFQNEVQRAIADPVSTVTGVPTKSALGALGQVAEVKADDTEAAEDTVADEPIADDTVAADTVADEVPDEAVANDMGDDMADEMAEEVVHQPIHGDK